MWYTMAFCPFLFVLFWDKYLTQTIPVVLPKRPGSRA